MKDWLTYEVLAELDALEKAATPGPWRACRANGGACPCGLVWSGPNDCPVASVEGDSAEFAMSEPERLANWAFIVAARSAIRPLIGEVRRLRAFVARIETIASAGPRFTDRHMAAAADDVLDDLRSALAEVT